jgi:hypothetical protein
MHSSYESPFWLPIGCCESNPIKLTQAR